MTREFQKIFFIILLSLFMHLAILQVRFESTPSSSLSYSTTEVGLVQRPLPSSVIRSPAENALQKPVTEQAPVSKNTLPATSVVESETRKASQGGQANRVKLVPDVVGEVATASDPGELPKLTGDDATTVSATETRPSSDNVAEGIPKAEEHVVKNADKTDPASAASVAIEFVEKRVEPAPEPVKPSPPAVSQSETTANLSESSILKSAEILQKGDVSLAIRNAVPRYDLNPAPVYPDIARRKGLEGRVWLKVMVRKDGSVERVEIDKSSGYRSLDRAAIKAVRRWQFVPAMYAGLPVAGGTRFPINFDLD